MIRRTSAGAGGGVNDRRAHLRDRALYRDFYEQDQQPGRIISMHRYEPRMVWACDHIGPDDDVLDVGTHKGEMAIALWSKTRGQVVGVDISHNALAHAVALARRADFDIVYAQGDAAALPFPSSSFDVAVLCEILEHVPDVDAVLAEAERVLRPGGRVVISVPEKALESDKMDAESRDRLTGFALDMHVREFDPNDSLTHKPGYEYARGEVKYPDGGLAYFHLAAYSV